MSDRSRNSEGKRSFHPAPFQQHFPRLDAPSDGKKRVHRSTLYSVPFAADGSDADAGASPAYFIDGSAVSSSSVFDPEKATSAALEAARAATADAGSPERRSLQENLERLNKLNKVFIVCSLASAYVYLT